jgi:hypothetical protein
MKHLTNVGAAAVLLLAAAGCSGSGGSGHSGPAAYLAAGNSRVAFIQWRATPSGHLRGTITHSTAGGSAPAQTMAASSAPFTGTIRGSTVRLNFAEPFFLRTGARGTLSGDRLMLRLPQPDGAIAQVTFSQSGPASYHRAITALRHTIRRGNRQAAVHPGSHAQDPAAGPAEQAASRSLTALYHQSSLASGGVLARALSRVSAHVDTARSDLATEKHDAAGRNRYCTAAFKVSGDAQSVDGDLASVQGDIKALMADISAVRAEIATSRTHLRHLRKAGLPAPAASKLIASAKTSLRHAIATANTYIDQINAIDAHARTLANKTATGPCSGARSGSSTMPIPHINRNLAH